MPPRAISPPSAYRGPVSGVAGDGSPGGAAVSPDPNASASPASRDGSAGGVSGLAACERVGSGFTGGLRVSGVHPRFADPAGFAEGKSGKWSHPSRRSARAVHGVPASPIGTNGGQPTGGEDGDGGT